MRAGATRAYWVAVGVGFAVFVSGVFLNSGPLILLSLCILALGIVLFYGREVRIERGRVILEWGLLRRRKIITSDDVLDVIDAPSSRYLVLARYLPEAAIVPALMVLFGVLAVFESDLGWVGLGWLLFSGASLVSYILPEAEKGKGALLILLITAVVALAGYYLREKMVVPIVVSGLLLAVMFWEGGPMVVSMVLLVTGDGVYEIRYGSKRELKELLSALGDVNEG
ncbi:hypothetical protein A3L11_04075 [Thermococcus siculi]|uniref:Uncharacterized protein n=2 Tax=Thermococcus siculi TaxID=72803 RepID=A0A2Z2MJ34_9EURY|nr:hypothetical protein A3L11_04075 [Thermococcus siculi]